MFSTIFGIINNVYGVKDTPAQLVQVYKLLLYNQEFVQNVCSVTMVT